MGTGKEDTNEEQMYYSVHVRPTKLPENGDEFTELPFSCFGCDGEFRSYLFMI